MGNFDLIETDKRILEQKLRRHQLSHQEYNKLLKGLPDDKERLDEVAGDRSGELRREQK